MKLFPVIYVWLKSMRDYKNVKVPRKYRSGATRVSVKRADAGHGKKKSGKSALKLLANILMIALMCGGVWLGLQGYERIIHAEAFQISGIDVRGVRELTDGDLKKIVGHFTGQNIFRVDLQEAARRARSNPWIRDVRIYRSLPNRIAMDVVERVPLALLDTGTGRFLMDHDTVVIDRTAKEEARQLPVIAIPDCRARPGEPVAAASINEAVTLLAEIEARGGWNPAEITIKASTPDAISIVYAGHEFKIGSGRHDEKLRRLAEVMADAHQRNLKIAYVDLRPESQVAVMLRNDGAQPAANEKSAGSRQQKTNKRR